MFKALFKFAFTALILIMSTSGVTFASSGKAKLFDSQSLHHVSQDPIAEGVLHALPHLGFNHATKKSSTFVLAFETEDEEEEDKEISFDHEVDTHSLQSNFYLQALFAYQFGSGSARNKCLSFVRPFKVSRFILLQVFRL